MATTPGQRFVRRHDAARTSTSNTTAADISYDTAVISEGGYSWSSPEVTVDEAGLYLCMFDIGEVQLSGGTRAVGTLIPSVNTTDQTLYKARHRYLRDSGGNHGASFGACILDLAANDDVKIRNPGTVTGTDALLNYATNVNQGGGFQLIRLNDGNYTEVQRTTSQSPITITYANATRPWLDSTATWTQLTFTSEVRDDDGLYSGSGGDITLAANTKYLIVYGATFDGSSAQRHTHHLALDIAGTRVQHSTGYERNDASDGPPMQGMYLHETGGTSETLGIYGAVEQEDNAVSNTVGCDNAYVQVLELPSGAEWIHADNGTTDSLTTAWAGTSTYYDTPLSSTFRADGDSDLSLDSANDAIQNDSGASLPVLAIGWHMTDRDAGTSGTRKHTWCYWDNGGTRLAYGITGGYNRGQQGNDDTHRLGYVGGAVLDLANAADLSFVTRDPVSSANSDMGVYNSTSRYFLGVQVLKLDTLAASTTVTLSGTASSGAASVTGNVERVITSSGTIQAQSSVITGNVDNFAVETLSGNVSAQSSGISGNVTNGVVETLSGTVQAQSSGISGAVERAVTLSGTVQSQSASIVGDRIVQAQPATITGTVTVVSGNITLSGTVVADSATLTGDITNFAVETLSGTIASQNSDISGSIERAITISGTIQSQSASISGDVANFAVETLSGTLQSQSAAISGVIERAITLSGTVQAQNSGITGQVERAITINGVVGSVSANITGDVSISGNVSLSGTVSAAASSITGTIERVVTASGVIQSASASISGAVERAVNLNGVLSSGNAALTGAIERVVTVNGTIQADSSSITGQVERVVILNGILPAQNSDISGAITVGGTVVLSGTVQAQSSGITGQIERAVTLSGSIQADSSSITGAIERVITLNGSIAADNSLITGDIERAIILNGAVSSDSSGISGNITNAIAHTLSGTVQSTDSSISGNVERVVTLDGTVAASDSGVTGVINRILDYQGTVQSNNSSIIGTIEIESLIIPDQRDLGVSVNQRTLTASADNRRLSVKQSNRSLATTSKNRKFT